MKIVKGLFCIIGKMLLMIMGLVFNLISMAASLFLSVLTMFIVTALKS